MKTCNLLLATLLFIAHLSFSQAPELPIDFEDETLNYGFGGYGDPNFEPLLMEIDNNPSTSGINTSDNVLHISKPDGSQTWAGGSMALGTAVDLSVSTEITMMVYAPQVGMPINFVLQEAGGSTNKAQLAVMTTQSETWEILTFDMATADGYDPAHVYESISIEPNFGNMGVAGATEFYFDDIQNITPTAPEKPSFPVDFEDPNLNYLFGGYGDPNFDPILVEISNNPNASGINTSASVLHLSKPDGSQTWAGTTMALKDVIDFSGGTTFTMKVHAPQIGMPINFVFQEDGGGVKAELSVMTTIANEWETITFDMSQATGFDPAAAYKFIAIEPNFGNMGIAGATEFYFDDIEDGSGNNLIPTIPIDFESSTLMYGLAGYGDPNFMEIPVEITDNPFQGGINFSAKSLHITKPEGSQTWAGASLAIGEAIDVANNPMFSIKVLAPDAGMPINLIFQEEGGSPNKAQLAIPTVFGGTWETLLFDMSQADGYDPSHSYKVISIEPNFGNMGIAGATEFYFDDFAYFLAPDGPFLPEDFESPTINYETFGYGDPNFDPVPTGISDNPDASGVNTSNRVWFIQKPAGSQDWAGASMPLALPIDMNQGPYFYMKVWSPTAGTPILLSFENSTDPATIYTEAEVNTTKNGSWEILSFNMTEHINYDPNEVYNLVSINPNNGFTGVGATYYFDDIQYGGDVVSFDELNQSKINVNVFPNPVNEWLTIQAASKITENISIEIIDVFGRKINELTLIDEQKINVQNWNSGTYLLLIKSNNELMKVERVMVF